MFVKVPRQIVKYSIENNRLILPVFLYSAIHANQRNNFIVDTNVMHIVETFNPHEDNRKGYNGKYIDTVKLLAKGVPNEFSECIQLKSFIDESDASYSDTYEKLINSINKNDRLQYYFLTRILETDNKFISIDDEEYFHLVILSLTSMNVFSMNLNSTKMFYKN